MCTMALRISAEPSTNAVMNKYKSFTLWVQPTQIIFLKILNKKISLDSSKLGAKMIIILEL